ncbi:hypothetical protein WJX72_011359 [[Myrmecia] bisecta]|uniref:Uncharacterized protein n=1 Tax=[Myrmecia] bisecta TaxID=41462 RepID=A0AAW1PII2_9CHLO
MQQQSLAELCNNYDAPLPATIEQGANMLRTQLGGQRVLLVLDDVPSDANALEALLFKDKLPAGSYVIITS